MAREYFYTVPVVMTRDEIDAICKLSEKTGLLMSEVIQKAVETYCEIDGWMND